MKKSRTVRPTEQLDERQPTRWSEIQHRRATRTKPPARRRGPGRWPSTVVLGGRKVSIRRPRVPLGAPLAPMGAGHPPGRDPRAQGRRQGPSPGPTLGRRHGARSRSPTASGLEYPDDVSMRISHEAVYQALYIQGRGALRRELTACLRTGQALRVPRARRRGRGKAFVGPEILIRKRPPEVEDRGSWTLGGRPHHRTWQLRNRHIGRTYHPIHDVAPPAPPSRTDRRAPRAT